MGGLLQLFWERSGISKNWGVTHFLVYMVSLRTVPCLMYIMRIAGLDEAQAGIKIAGRNTNNLRYADDSTLMAESEEELKRLLMKVKKLA